MWLAVFFPSSLVCFILYWWFALSHWSFSFWRDLDFFLFFSYVLLIFFIRNYCLIHSLGFSPEISSKAFIVQFCYLLQVILCMIAFKLGVLYFVNIHSDSPLLFVDYILFFSLVPTFLFTSLTLLNCFYSLHFLKT